MLSILADTFRIATLTDRSLYRAADMPRPGDEARLADRQFWQGRRWIDRRDVQ